MGCFHSKSESIKNKRKNSSSTKTYSWDNKEKVNPKDYTIENLKGETAGKLPGSVNGQQFIIQNCENSNIYIFDHINTATVDDCKNCNVFIGPTKGSVFLRDCHECRFVIACQQFRARDCKDLDVFLCCSTQPIIESCTEMRFGCFCFHYKELDEQFKKASLSTFNNNWNNIHDFTPTEVEENWNLLPKNRKIEEFFPLPSSEELSSVQISMAPHLSVVPQTNNIGESNLSDESCLVVFFPDGQAQKRALSYIRELNKTSNMLIRTKEIKLDESQAERIFGTDSYNGVVIRGPVFSLEYSGENCIKICQEKAKAIATETGSTGLVYVSSSAKTARKQVEALFNYADIQLSI
ncbi:protein XRP2-like [Centruroides vittatus]|uniref:protein XRP2-like n=1 Tax=Centruroides vittatus TaxID=120091 RepID=UPI00351082C9